MSKTNLLSNTLEVMEQHNKTGPRKHGPVCLISADETSAAKRFV